MRFPVHGFSAFALGAGLLLAAPAAIAPAHAQEGSLTGGILSLFGITSPDAPDIEYRERPPLVVPPRSTLPSPQEREDARARANWPNDPDRERRRAARADANTPATQRELDRLDRDARSVNRNLRSPTGGQSGSITTYDRTDQLYYEPMRQMREADARRAAQQVERPVGEEPPRRFLSDPPRGLRSATERVSPAQEPVRRSDSTGQLEFATGRPTPN